MTLLVTMNREKSIQQLMEYHATNIAEDRAKAAEHSDQIEELDVELATINIYEAAERNQDDTDIKIRQVVVARNQVDEVDMVMFMESSRGIKDIVHNELWFDDKHVFFFHGVTTCRCFFLS